LMHSLVIMVAMKSILLMIPWKLERRENKSILD
jgi:hypothetical protein